MRGFKGSRGQGVEGRMRVIAEMAQGRSDLAELLTPAQSFASGSSHRLGHPEYRRAFFSLDPSNP
jgi:hypothetical protein